MMIKNFLQIRIEIKLLFALTLLAPGTTFSQSLEEKIKEAFWKSEVYAVEKNKVISQYILFQNAFKKSGFNFNSEVYTLEAADIKRDQLSVVDRFRTHETSMALGADYLFVDSPYLSSLRLATEIALKKYDYQLISPAAAPTQNDARQVSFELSYDVLKGGIRNPTYISSQAERLISASAIYENFNEIKSNYISFLTQTFAVLVAHCKLRNFEQSLAAIEKTEEIFQIGNQLKTISYKDYLNVKSLRNIIENRKFSSDINFNNSFQSLSVFGPEAQKIVQEIIQGEDYCRKNLGLASDHKNEINIDPAKLSKAYQKTLTGLALKSAVHANRKSIRLAEMALRPSLSPYVNYTQVEENILAIEDKRIEVGVRLNWDFPTGYTKANVSREIADLSSTASLYRVSEQRFIAEITNLNRRNANIIELNSNIKETIGISDELLKILNTQQSIGRVDSLTLTNAILNRNDSLNQLYDINAELILNNYRYLYEFKWEAITKPLSSYAL